MYHNTSKSFCKVKVRSGKGEINYGPADLPTPSDHLWPKNFVQGLYTPFNFFDIKYGVGPQGKEKCSSQCFLNGILTFPLTTNVCSGSLHIRYPISFWWMGIYGINLVIGKNMCPRQVMFRRTDGRIKWRTDRYI